MPVGKLGRIAPAIPPYKSRRVLNLEDYFSTAMRPPPPSVMWSKFPMAYEMLRNDVEGCCTISTLGHKIKCWTATTGSPIVVPDAEIDRFYSAVSGYDPTRLNPLTGENPTDTGCVMKDVYDSWKKYGLNDGHTINQIVASVAVDPQNLDHVKWSINNFGCVGIGASLPQSALDQTNNHQPWSVVHSPFNKIVGGHAISLYDYDTKGYFRGTTWGGYQEITPEWFLKYVDEVWVAIDPYWIDSNGFSPIGLKMGQMLRDATLLAAA